uniref:Putative ribonuclease H-like domain-containing protein n=1 Tax=Tanacetum cinerariifolium TaxID=118510 RepID=A0A6L2NDT2_TANCI|nr:putative ribonuclease H-like domain-containing protein [Tanacetum cinerariifolium]
MNINFNSYKTTKSLMQAIEKRYEVNTAHGVSTASSKTNASNLPNVDSLRVGLKVVDGNVDYESQKISIENRKESRKCRASKQQDNRYMEAPKRTVSVEDTTSNALVTQCAYKAGLASVEARLEVYKKDDIKILKLNVMLRDKSITELRQKFEKAEKERDDLKLTLERSQDRNLDLIPIVSESVTSLPDIAKSKVKISETKLKNIKLSFDEEKFIKYTEHVKSPRKSVKQEESNRQTKYPKKTSQSSKVLTNSGLKTLNTARHPSSRAAVSVNTARPINIAYPRSIVNGAKPSSNVFHKSRSPVMRTFNQRTTPQNSDLKETVNTAKAEAVSTTCYVQNRVLLTKPYNKTPYELLIGRSPNIDFMKPFRCPVTILNTLYHLGKFKGKADEGFLVGYSVNSIEINVNAGQAGQEKASDHEYILLLFMPSHSPLFSSSQSSDDNDANEVPGKGHEGVSKGSKHDDQESSNNSTQDVNTAGPNINTANTNINNGSLNINIVGSNDLSMSTLEETSIFDDVYDDREVGAEADTNNLELSTIISLIPTTRVHKEHPKEQIIRDLNLATQTRRMINFSKEMLCVDTSTNREEQITNIIRTIYLPVFSLNKNPKRRGIIDKTLFIKKDRGDILLVQVYIDDIIFGSTKKFLCDDFEQMMHKRFQMSSIGELTFFLGLHVKQKDDGIFISQDKYMADILKKFDFTTVKTESTLIEPNKALTKDAEAEDVDVHLYRLMIRSLMYIEIRHYFIRDSYEKKLIQVIKIHIYNNVADLLTKAFDYWTSAKVKTVNEDVRLQALVDGKKVIVNEASIRRDLRLDDVEGTACPSNAAIFEELARMRRKQRKETEVSQDKKPTEEHIPTPSHGPLPSGEDRLQLNELMEICTKLSNRVLSLEQINTNQAARIEKLKKRVKKLEGKKKKKKRTHGLKRIYKGRMNDHDMFGVNDLDGDEVVVDVSAREKEEHSEKVAKKEVSTTNPVTTADEVVTTDDVEVSAVLTTTTTTDDELTLAQTLIAIKAAKPKALITAATTVTAVSTRPKEKGIIMQEPSKTPSPKPIVSSQQPSQPKDKGKAKIVKPKRPLKRKEQIMIDEQIASNLEGQMQANLEEEQRITKQKEEETNIAMIAKWNNTQAMMDANYELAAKL